jgi:hypothetical protein
MATYANNMTIFESELTRRSNVVRDNIISNFGLSTNYSIDLQVEPENAGYIQINTISPEVYPWTGIYFAGVPIKLEAKGNGNYIFDGWYPNNIVKDLTNPVYEGDVKISGYNFTAKFKLQTITQAITISEINYSSGDVFPTTDWIELYNYGSASISLAGWYIADDNMDHKWVIPGSLNINPNDRIVLASDINKFNNAYPDAQNVYGSFLFGLGSPSDSVRLFNSSNKLIAGVKYSSDPPWPAGTFDSGRTLELKDPNADINNPDNWFAGCIGGSPGAAYSNCDVNGISIPFESFTASIYPNPVTDQLNIVIPSGMKNQNIVCRVFDIMGKEVINETFTNLALSSQKLSVANLPEGVYIMKLSNKSYNVNLKFVKGKEF